MSETQEAIDQAYEWLRRAEKAQEFKDTWGGWLEDQILKELDTEAMRVLRAAMTENDRMSAQAMSLAALKVRTMIDVLIDRAVQARQTILDLSTRKEDENARG